MARLGETKAHADPEALSQIWLDFKVDGCIEARNKLAVHYVSLVRVTALKVAAGLPAMVDREDLVSYGIFGLLDAIDKFDLEAGVKFETYAVTRIRGSILDEIRSLDWVPRTIRAKTREVERAESELAMKLGRPAEDPELAEYLGVSIEEVWRLRSQSSQAATVIGYDTEGQDEWSRGEGFSKHDPVANPEDIYLSQEIVDLLAGAIENMPQRSKTILALYYFHEMTLAEIGEILGVTESRACQLQSKLLQSLHLNLAETAA